MITLITWNLGGTKFARQQASAWSYVVDELKADIVLVQEAMLNVACKLALPGAPRVTPSVPASPWGSGIWARGFEPRRMPMEAYGSYLHAAEVDTASGPLVVVSAHVCPGEEQFAWLRTLARTLGDRLRDRPSIVAGDFNAARRWDKVHGGSEYGKFFEQMTAEGFHDCHWALHGREVPTFWRFQYQDDHAFVSASWAGRVVSCDVIDNERVRKLSDHAPVRLVLNE